MEYKILDEKYKTEINQKQLIVTALMPQAISFLRGYLFASTQNMPSNVILPLMDVYECFKEKLEMDEIQKEKKSKIKKK